MVAVWNSDRTGAATGLYGRRGEASGQAAVQGTGRRKRDAGPDGLTTREVQKPCSESTNSSSASWSAGRERSAGEERP